MPPEFLEEIVEQSGEVIGLNVIRYQKIVDEPLILKRSPVKWCCFRPMKRRIVYKKVPGTIGYYERDRKSTYSCKRS